jgi:probable rRNA maturation factor
MKIEIVNLTKKRISSDLVKKIVRKTIKSASADLSLLEISVVFVNEAEIRKINRKYRQKNKSTDVLSFRYNLGYNKKEEVLEGELMLCPEIIANNARAHKVKFDRELAFVLSHGVLHILGWRHGEKMYELQDEVIGK